MADEFVMPDFLQDSDVDLIHNRMLEILPEDIDRTEAGFLWDFTRPTALMISEMLQYYIPETIKLAFPDWSSGIYLDMIGKLARVSRRPGTFAKAVLFIEGTEGTVIPAGSVFSTESLNGTASIEFETDEDGIIGEEGEIYVPATAVEEGTESNVGPWTITVATVPIPGVTDVTNPEAATGGYDIEDDDTFRERILDALRNMDNSYIANDADFIRWSKEVSGIGDCIVISDDLDPGIVKLILVDVNGKPASERLIDAVYEHIVSPSDRSKRLLPTGSCKLIVLPADLVRIDYTCTGIILEDSTIEEVTELFKTLVATAYSQAKGLGVLRYNDIRPLIKQIEGIKDFEDFRMNGGHENIRLASSEYAETGEVIFTERG